tara:strand:- start:205 stop:408 length:204 start_codon:yes stop_codon:yes gene_type:complete
MITLLVLSAELLLALLIAPEAIEAVAEVISTLSLAVACVGTGGTVGLSARHWGAKEGSSFKEEQVQP